MLLNVKSVILSSKMSYENATLYFGSYKEGSKYPTHLFKMENMCIICLK